MASSSTPSWLNSKADEQPKQKPVQVLRTDTLTLGPSGDAKFKQTMYHPIQFWSLVSQSETDSVELFDKNGGHVYPGTVKFSEAFGKRLTGTIEVSKKLAEVMGEIWKATPSKYPSASVPVDRVETDEGEKYFMSVRYINTMKHYGTKVFHPAAPQPMKLDKIAYSQLEGKVGGLKLRVGYWKNDKEKKCGLTVKCLEIHFL